MNSQPLCCAPGLSQLWSCFGVLHALSVPTIHYTWTKRIITIPCMCPSFFFGLFCFYLHVFDSCYSLCSLRCYCSNETSGLERLHDLSSAFPISDYFGSSIVTSYIVRKEAFILMPCFYTAVLATAISETAGRWVIGRCREVSPGYDTNYGDLLPELPLLTCTLRGWAAFSMLRHFEKYQGN